MTKANFTGIFILIGFISYAQNTFTLNTQIGFTTININGEHYIIDSVGREIITNYPSFDSLIFIDNGGYSAQTDPTSAQQTDPSLLTVVF